MSGFAPLSRPAQSQVNLDQSINRPQADGFTFPIFRLLNKQARVTLSENPLQPSNVRRVLTTANTNGGWFAATTSSGLIVSRLSELREAFSGGSDAVFTPQRTLPCNPVSIAFACNDTRLLAGTEQGQILVFDAAQLFSSSAQVDPIQVFQGSSSPAMQILPNPSTENELAQLVAIVRVDGTVQMFNMQMESKGAWTGTDFDSTPVAASWSPKGKQLAIGLRTGDILTFGLTNNTLPLKHIPATANSPLVSLQWIGPTFTFRTSYGSDPRDPPHHIVSLDTRSNTAGFVQLTHPFPLPDRSQNAQVLILPRWDQDATPASTEEAKILIVVGDLSSTDLEVIGNSGTSWFQQSQENPLSVPLDKNDEDTFLLTLDVDLTSDLPIMYAYLNDGTVQGWYITHPDSKPYAGLAGAAQASPSAPAFGQHAPSAQQQSAAPSTFGQQSTTSGFGQPSAFGQTSSSTSAFGQPSAFGQQPTFGQTSFGAQSSPSPFGSSSNTSVFGQSAFGAQSSIPSLSPFGSPSSTSAFGGSGATSAFGSSTGGGFGAFASSSNTPFGAPSNPPSAPPLNSTPSVSMGEATPSAFGGLSLGGSTSESSDKPKAVGGGMFGSPSPLPLPPNHPANQPSTPTPSAFSDGNLIKPASGFGAFGAVSSGAFGNPKAGAFGSGGAFSGGGSSTTDNKPAAPSGPAAPAFGKSSFGQPGFGQSAFGQTGFGQTGFGQKPVSAFGQSGFGVAGVVAPATAPGAGGFSAFASVGPTAFANAAGGSASNTAASGAPSTALSSSSAGSGAFSSAVQSAFGKPPSSTNGGSVFGGGSPAVPSPSAGAGSSTPSTPPSAFAGFGAPTSPFGNKTPQPAPAVQQTSASSSPDSARDGRSPSPTDSPPQAPSQLTFATSSPSMTTGAFGNLKSASSGFKPASGFGAFGNDTTPTSSPFFNAASQTKPPVSAFGSLGSSLPATPTPAAGKPAFGSPSVLGGAKSAFSPITPSSTSAKSTTPVSGGFGAFGGSPIGLTSAATPAKSFGELLKAGDDTPEKPKPVSAFGFQSKPASSTTPIKPIPVFSPPPKDAEQSTPKGKGNAGETPPTDDDEKEPVVSSESSFGELSQGSSSFVEVSGVDAEDADGEAEEDAGEEPGDDDNDGDSFLSESFGSDSEAPPDDDDDYSRSPSPSAVPLPPSRSPSSTPHAEVPAIQVSSSPTPSEESDSSEGSRLSTIREESTTPPGSPEKKEPPPKTPLAAPTPVAPPPFGIGLGRPSTRPTRSSPLANAPVSCDEDDKEKPVPVLDPAKPHSTSPKPFFGTIQPKIEPIEEPKAASKPTRPKTPPLSALSFGFPAPNPPSNVGKVPLAGAPLPALASPSKTSPVIPGSSSTPPPVAPGGFFGLSTPKATPPPTTSTPAPALKGFFGMQPLAHSSKPPSPAPLAPPPEAAMEEGMQKECALLFESMTRELEDFRLLAQAAGQKRMELRKSAGGSRRAVDLGNRAKWALPDAVQFGQTMRLYEQDLADLKEDRAQKEKLLRELQSNLLKAGTRREEIGRFLKAQHDNDFAKMLKARTLGPEHLETQTHLRRSIRAMQDRIQKLESHLQESKKRLSRANTGNPGLRAPTLDTLNRTFRNMDIALDNQTGDVERLAARIAKLDVKDRPRNGHRAGTRDVRLPDPVTRQRPFNVTPHVAVTTAAALNAERSAHKLKRSLLSVRKEPLLNTQAASAPSAPLAFQTPQRSGLGLGLGLAGPGTPARSLSFGTGSSTPPQSTMFGFDFPEDNFNPSPPPAVRRGAGGSGKTRISNSVPLKRSPGQLSTPSPPPSFDWGPLPNFQKKPVTLSPENSLGGSWVSEGFGSKK
ncbi:hypothetical protein DFH07DRAFT_932330 [Mycena maculata]|uniref:Nucleoporin Nup159/Nup146 N-terminal domain-containing protein n=1 Tax=Mycena maculata TaxID=230809 RepID=A0AAD7HLL2_9AGAR|nr:hypothetical protein DFH07DRAFT_932330 [Mycena maculata]